MVPPASHRVPRVPRYSGSSQFDDHFRIQGSHPLWPAFPDRSPNDHLTDDCPQPQVINHLVWPLPRSLATTSGISVDFFSSPYLDVSVQAVPLIYLFIQYMMTGHDSSRIAPFGYLWITAYLRLPIAFRSLLRPSSAPSAKAFPLCSL